MRLLLLLVSAGYASANCVDGSTNCSELSLIRENAFHGNGTRVRRSTSLKVPDVQKGLNAAATVATTLGDIEITQNFQRTFAGISAKIFKNGMKGLSILGSIAAAFISVDDDTQQILTKMDKGFNRLESRLEGQAANITRHISETLFRYNVMYPVRTVERARRKYEATVRKNVPSEEAKKEFLRSYYINDMDNVIVVILGEYERLQKLIISASTYNRAEVVDMRDTTWRYFLGAQAIKSFCAGIRFDYFENKTHFDQEVAHIEKQYNKDLTELNNINARIWKNFNNNYWKSGVPPTVREAIDKGEDNCEMAQNVLKAIKAKEFTHFVHVIVLNQAPIANDGWVYNVYNPLLDKTLVQDYAGKTILVTPPHTENEKTRNKYIKAYNDQNMEQDIKNLIRKTHDIQTAPFWHYTWKANTTLAMFRNEFQQPCAISQEPKALRFLVDRSYFGEYHQEWSVALMF